jgi:hypothetical protein
VVVLVLLQMMWSEDHQDYGTYAQGPDGTWLWYSAKVTIYCLPAYQLINIM